MTCIGLWSVREKKKAKATTFGYHVVFIYLCSEKFGLKLNIQKMKIMASGPITSWEIDGKQWKQCQTLFFWAPKSLQMVTAARKLKDAYSLEGKL